MILIVGTTPAGVVARITNSKDPHQQSNFVILLKLVILSLFSGLVVFHCFMSQNEAQLRDITFCGAQTRISSLTDYISIFTDS